MDFQDDFMPTEVGSMSLQHCVPWKIILDLYCCTLCFSVNIPLWNLRAFCSVQFILVVRFKYTYRSDNVWYTENNVSTQTPNSNNNGWRLWATLWSSLTRANTLVKDNGRFNCTVTTKAFWVGHRRYLEKMSASRLEWTSLGMFFRLTSNISKEKRLNECLVVFKVCETLGLQQN